MLAACGGEPQVDPDQIAGKALDDLTAREPGRPPRGAEVEVASLGFEDNPLRTRTLAVDPPTYRTIRELIAGSRNAQGSVDDPEEGILPLVGELEARGEQDLDGVRVEHISGELDVDLLISSLTDAVAGGAASASGEDLPGLGDLAQLEQNLVGASFDLFAESADGSFEQLDLTLSLDDRENALPPTRLRFSLREQKVASG